ncbi:secondary thiamine-phosphate synthase enzyme YjbQ [Caldisericum exile]|uniref:YjbQ family protein n=1 Tax=Caldisericum exile (strain DSM 21853 / NBRC 104410 / AZM16c01) TaxID=511051 RepID=A0A7U6JFD5_CALEA|nr:secondary thiamine-phosphate synthase enzyme YjbQ [Caldisericum exile]BAL81363.1 hypothetical protein CSE_12370 [Caldisericum exile AZM16c01]
MEIFTVRTSKREEMIEITSRVQEIVRNSKVQSGICVVYIPHTTASITINENADPSVKKDIINYLSKLIPENANYSHLEGNADAHIKASIMGQSRAIIIRDGRLVLGTWQGIFFVEFDGPRTREVFVEIVPKIPQGA